MPDRVGARRPKRHLLLLLLLLRYRKGIRQRNDDRELAELSASSKFSNYLRALVDRFHVRGRSTYVQQTRFRTMVRGINDQPRRGD